MRSGESEPKAMLLTMWVMRPLFSSPKPRAMPPAISQRTSQSIVLRSATEMIRVAE